MYLREMVARSTSLMVCIATSIAIFLLIETCAGQLLLRDQCSSVGCLSATVDACDGACFIDLAADTNSLNRDTESLIKLCGKKCLAAWSANETIACLFRDDSEEAAVVLQVLFK